jgi:hypothetical protein
MSGLPIDFVTWRAIQFPIDVNIQKWKVAFFFQCELNICVKFIEVFQISCALFLAMCHMTKVSCTYQNQHTGFSPPFSRKMDTAPSRYNEPLNLQHGSPRPMKDMSGLRSYLTPREHMADSAECWSNASQVPLIHQGKSAVNFHLSTMLGLRMLGVYSITCECGQV